MRAVIDVTLLAALLYRGSVAASYATTAIAATIKQYLIVAREAAWSLGFEKQMTVGLTPKMGSNT